MLEDELLGSGDILVITILHIFCQLREPQVETPEVFLHPLGAGSNGSEPNFKELWNRVRLKTLHMAKFLVFSEPVQRS